MTLITVTSSNQLFGGCAIERRVTLPRQRKRGFYQRYAELWSVCVKGRFTDNEVRIEITLKGGECPLEAEKMRTRKCSR